MGQSSSSGVWGRAWPKTLLVHFQLEGTHIMATNCWSMGACLLRPLAMPLTVALLLND